MTMDQVEQLPELIGEIYDAALDPSLWNDVVGKVARFVGGSAAVVVSKNPTAGNGNAYDEPGTDPYSELYFDKYAELDPSRTGRYFADIGQSNAIAYCRTFLETRFYEEWARPQALADFLSAVLDKSANDAELFGVFSHERDGIVDDETRRRMRLIVPHIRQAALVGRLIDLKAADTAYLADTLDGLSAGMCLVDAVGRILHANVACHGILDAGDFLSVVDGRLVASDARIDQALRELFAADGGDAAIGIRGIGVPLKAQDGSCYVAHVLPLTSGVRRLAGITYSATAALFVCKAATQIRSSPEAIARAYNLTPAELRVLMAIVEVGGVPEVAVALGVAESTVKTHLAHLFVKTGTGRQADLVKIVAGFATPLIGRSRPEARTGHS
jgi:DNA-binding CsgD family transcriptional regulator